MSRRLAIASLIWTVALLASRVLGLIRDAVLGATLGVGPEADAYAAAFRIPDLLGMVVSGGALSIVFIPMFTGMLTRGEEARAWAAFSRVANLILVLALVLVPALWVAMPHLTALLAPGFDAEQAALLVRLSRIVLPAQVFHLLSGLLGAALLSRDRHTIPALAPLVYNGAIIVLGWWMGSAEGFAWGVLVGAFLGPFLLPLLACLQDGLRWEARFDWGHEEVRRYLAAALPIMFAFSIVGLDDVLWTHSASGLDPGSVASLQYAKTLMRVPIGVFGFAMGYAAYPTLARLHAEGRPKEAWETLRAAVARTLVLAFGSQIVLTVASPEIGTLVYGSTRIPPDRMASLGTFLGAFSLSIAAWSAQTLLSRGFYAQGRTWLPTRVGFFFMVLAVPAYAEAARRAGALGLALASSAVITGYVVTLYVLLRRGLEREPGLGPTVLRLVAATAMGLAVGVGLRGALGPFGYTRVEAGWRLLALAGPAGLTFLLVAWALGVEELRWLVGRVRRGRG
jgi:putative peptidoglycan lipid II flippase